jgi:4'-phosphopantetheinyl transferase
MTNNSCDQVRSLFTAVARDLTPAAAQHSSRVLYARFSSNRNDSINCRSILSVSEQQQATRITSDDERGLFQQRRAFRRFCGAIALQSALPLSKINFDVTRKGRPYLPDAPGICFSFSSCPTGMLGAWSSSHGIGVDIEDRPALSNWTELAQLFFSRSETESIVSVGQSQRLGTFLQYWTLKEAALKSIGEGLPFGLDAFEFALTPYPQLIGASGRYDAARQFIPFLIHGTNGIAALVTRQPG